jgi:hypothetical protein
MRLPRMTTRRWMAMILVGVTYSLACRSLALVALAAYHESKLPHRWDGPYYSPVCYDRSGRVMTKAQVRAAREHRDLAKDCRKAALWPWLPVDPTLPEPEPAELW